MPDTSGDLERLAVFYRSYLSSPMGVCYTDPEGKIRDANRAFLALYGYALEEVIGNTPRILKSGRQSPAAYQALWRDISDPAVGSWSGELINRRSDGQEIYIHLTISAVRRDDGSLIGFVASTIDITARKKLELALAARNQELEHLNRFRNDMVAVTSHDLKAPLHAMISYAELIREQGRGLPPARTEEYLGKIRDQGTQLLRFIGELLDLTKIEAGKFQLHTTRTRLEEILRACVEVNEAHGRHKGIGIRFHPAPGLRPAVVDEMRMTQVFNNLLSNALKHSPSESEIRVTCREEPGGQVTMTFEDEGPGIPPEDLCAIFEPYYQVTKGGHAAQRAFGAGIGLSVVKRIVELHGGAVSVENKTPRGCRFAIAMPARTFTAPRSLAALVFDPRAAVFPYLEAALRTQGLPTFIARTPAELRRIGEHERPDLLFVDARDLSVEADACLGSLREADPGLTLVAVCEEERCPDPRFSRTLVAPVLDTEVSALLQEIFLDKIAPPASARPCPTRS
jgi:PAS domain S-box-containing protein